MKEAIAIFSATLTPVSYYRFIATERSHYHVQRLCQVLSVPANGFTPSRPVSYGPVVSETRAWKAASVKMAVVY